MTKAQAQKKKNYPYRSPIQKFGEQDLFCLRGFPASNAVHTLQMIHSERLFARPFCFSRSGAGISRCSSENDTHTFIHAHDTAVTYGNFLEAHQPHLASMCFSFMQPNISFTFRHHRYNEKSGNHESLASKWLWCCIEIGRIILLIYLKATT